MDIANKPWIFSVPEKIQETIQKFEKVKEIIEERKKGSPVELELDEFELCIHILKTFYFHDMIENKETKKKVRDILNRSMHESFNYMRTSWAKLLNKYSAHVKYETGLFIIIRILLEQLSHRENIPDEQEMGMIHEELLIHYWRPYNVLMTHLVNLLDRTQIEEGEKLRDTMVSIKVVMDAVFPLCDRRDIMMVDKWSKEHLVNGEILFRVTKDSQEESNEQ